MIVDFVVGMTVSALSGMGVGGGGLLVLYLVLVKNIGQIEAQATNLLFFITSATVAFLYNVRKRQIDFRLCFLLGGCGITGAILGALCANMISPQTVRKMFGWLLILSGVWSFFANKKKK